VWLLDGNVLVALLISTHPHHRRAERWLISQKKCHFATCAVTEGTLLRLHMQLALDASAQAAWSALASVRSHPRHLYWEDGFSYSEISPTRLTGHRQVTDAWLAELAQRRKGRVATLDDAFSVLYKDRVVLIPV
jgi:toxin-antitoxin system PIN domain toxin